MTTDHKTQQIRDILAEYGRLGLPALRLSDDADLRQAGLTSHASVNVMLALESAFEVEFPDHMLSRNVFGSIATLRAALEELTAQ
jgi:acyl carrier protein